MPRLPSIFTNNNLSVFPTLLTPTTYLATISLIFTMTFLPSLPTTLTPALSSREAIADAIYRCVLGLDTNDSALFDSALEDNRR